MKNSEMIFQYGALATVLVMVCIFIYWLIHERNKK